MLKDQDRIFQNLYNDLGSDLISSQKRGDWVNTKEIISIDWDTYQIIGFDNIPNIKTDVLDKEGLPYLGVGEVVAGPTGAAISNAISDALGQTIKTMPFTKEIITKELLEN